MTLTIETCIDCINHAAMNRRLAIQLEIAVGLCVFLHHGGASREARGMLVRTYEAAGYRCVAATDADYKTINRRINTTAALYEKLPIKKWVGTLSEFDAVRAVTIGLEPYEIYTIADAQRHLHPDKQIAYMRTAVAPHPSILTPPAHAAGTGQEKTMELFRRVSDNANAMVLKTEHLSVMVPPGTTRDELISLAMQLLSTELLTA